MSTTSRIPQLSTEQEALEVLHVDPSTLQDLVTSGQLSAYNFGEQGLRFKEDDVEALARAAFVSMFDPCCIY